MIDQRVKDGKPLTITFHGRMDEGGEPPTEQWFKAMVEILDYLKEKEQAGEVEVTTHLELVNRYFPD